MPRYDFSAQRLFVEGVLAARGEFELGQPQTHYLFSVLRMRLGDRILVFNGRDGEWLAEIRNASKRSAGLLVVEQIRKQESGPDIDYCFAPLKHARLDYMVQKAVEMGARRLIPVLTKRTQVSRLNLARMRANAIEAAEQCGILAVPEIMPEMSLSSYLAERSAARLLIFCDEEAEVADPIAALRDRKREPANAGAFALLIGPEGGFDPSEREALVAAENVLPISLGPRILRADTAAVAGLALLQAVLGDWNGAQPRTTMSP
ncbi:MAG: 16S rRNA (uracil(1498)-N(3))-methyltransferase [Methylobacteriaceae bacterium]|nr:16S rRNA (uracil(1498)-N(3))-methyltransferase [Methylobacteriaceae bacterium]MBV9395544.1 16S rRNA (uracil(1498)-N(3))-methyltransferase [Methylobacteriaceae bacterium]